MVIFVSVGTHKQQFNRILEAIDDLVEKKIIKEKVFAQTGHSNYKPKNYSFKKFLEIKEFDKNIKACSTFITHAGEGNIGTALQHEKKMIIIPRRKKFDEHTNDHQLELAEAIAKEKQAIVIEDVKEIQKALKDLGNLKINKTKHAKGIINLIEKWELKNGE
jgi:UDP-N-acetylglucosamine transferase subunit ALG13